MSRLAHSFLMAVCISGEKLLGSPVAYWSILARVRVAVKVKSLIDRDQALERPVLVEPDQIVALIVEPVDIVDQVVECLDDGAGLEELGIVRKRSELVELGWSIGCIRASSNARSRFSGLPGGLAFGRYLSQAGAFGPLGQRTLSGTDLDQLDLGRLDPEPLGHELAGLRPVRIRAAQDATRGCPIDSSVPL
jgi:hypothetical protein